MFWNYQSHVLTTILYCETTKNNKFCWSALVSNLKGLLRLFIILWMKEDVPKVFWEFSLDI